MNFKTKIILSFAIIFALVAPFCFAQKNANAATPLPQKKKQKKSAAPPSTMMTTTTTQPSEKPITAKPETPAAGESATAESDSQRNAWRIKVAPFAVLGSGHPGKGASDFDKPDGVAFTPDGLLLATDAKNRRVQIWDVKNKIHLGEFGSKFFGGEIVDIAIASDGTVYITDQVLNLAYVFAPPKPGATDEKGKPLGPYDYQFKGTRFGEQGFDKLGGIAIDSRDRIYVVDAHLNDVRRFNPDGTADQTWKFERARSDGDTYLHGCEGIAIDEASGNLFIASEKDSVIQVFDYQTGAYKKRMVGAAIDASYKPSGKHIFFGSVEGLTFFKNHLFAVDEGAGHIQIFDLARPNAFNTDLSGYVRGRPVGYKGFFGHSPMFDFDDKNNASLQQQLKSGAIIPGQSNPPGYFCSPDAIASYTDRATNETYIAIADQCNYRLAVYRWSDIARATSTPAPQASEEQPAAKAKGKGGKKKKKP